MKQTKRSYIPFAFYDRTGIQRYLEKQARKGWMVDGVFENSWHFHRITPKKLHFSVTYYPGNPEEDAPISEGQLCFQEFLEYAGWIPAVAKGKFQIFYNEAENPTPIETDGEMELEGIHQAYMAHLKQNRWFLICIFLMWGPLCLLQFTDLFRGNPLTILPACPWLLGALLWILLFLNLLADMAGYFGWRQRAKRAARCVPRP